MTPKEVGSLDPCFESVIDYFALIVVCNAAHDLMTDQAHDPYTTMILSVFAYIAAHDPQQFGAHDPHKARTVRCEL